MLEIHRVEPAEWREVMTDAHLAVFKEKVYPYQERLDFTLVAVDGDDILSFVQCKEIDEKTLYWGYGGSFPSARDTVKSWRVYEGFVDWCFDERRYTRLFTYIENTNAVMLKFAAKIGWIIVGVRNVNGSIFLEHMLDAS